MKIIIIFLAMSFDVSGIGGLLSGIFSRSFLLAMIWAAGFGAVNIVLGWIVRDVPHFAPSFIFLLIALFWGLVGWLLVGRFRSRRRAAKAAARITITK